MMSKKKEGNPGLVDIVFSWSIPDIMDNNYYKNKVKQIEDRYSSLNHYLNSFTWPLIEETHAALRSSLTSLQSAPVAQILRVEEADKFQPPENLLYNLKLAESGKNSNVYEPEVEDLIALTQVRPKRVDDLVGAQLSFHLALVKGMKDEDTNMFQISSSKLILLDNASDGKDSGKGKDGFRHTFFVVSLTNLKTNLRIWKALRSVEVGNMGILSSVLTINPSMEERCARCSANVKSSKLTKLRELVMSLGLDRSQMVAVSDCIALSECDHRKSVKLIWGPPGTGKTKTIASLLFSLFKVKRRTLTCAPTNVAVLGVVKRLMTYLHGTLEFDGYGLGDVVLYANGKRMNIDDHEDVHDVFLDYRVYALMNCFAPLSGWKGSVIEMIRLLEDPETKYQRHLEQYKDKDGKNESVDNNDEVLARAQNGILKGKLKNEDLMKLVIKNKEKNKVDGDERREVNKDKKIDPLTFEEFFAKNFNRILVRIVECTEMLCTHMPTSCLHLNVVRNMIEAVDMLQSLKTFLRDNEWSKANLMGRHSNFLFQTLENLLGVGKKHDLCLMRLKCLELLNLLTAIQIPQLLEPYQIRNYCLRNSCLIFCTVSSSSKLHTQGGAPFELVIIDEAAQVKECESTIPMQLPGIRHAILVGDEKQLPAMVISEICKKAKFGRSLFERLVILGHSKHLLNVQYRMHPSISLFPNKEFYGNRIMNGRNVTETGHKRSFIKGKVFGSYSFINVTNGYEFDTKPGWKNMVEVSVIAEIVSKLYKESAKSHGKVRVGCISPYKGQVSAIQESFGKTYSSDAKDKFSVAVRSVDGFQGGEEDIIIISTVRCNGNGSIGFIDNLQRANVALTRARYCLWILGNADTLQNSNSVWQRLIADAKNRNCFHNAYDDKNLCHATRNALIELGQLRSLFTADSILFKEAKWKVCFSVEFHESIARYRDTEIQKEAACLLEKISSGWRQHQKDEGGICVEGPASKLLEWDVVKGPLRLVWTIDILRENSTDTQVIKVLQILPRSEVAEVVKKFEDVVGDYTVNQLERCLHKKCEGGVMLPMTWPVDRANSRSNYSSNELATQLSAMSLAKRKDRRRRNKVMHRDRDLM